MSLATFGIKKSPWVYHLACGACNNCDIEIVDCLTPRFDIERFGCLLVGSPRHADALLCSGIVTKKALPRVIEAYKQTAKPCIFVAIGGCAISMGMFKNAYTAAGPLDKVIREIDKNANIIYVPGCPPKPEAIILGVVKALKTLGSKK